LSLVDLCEVLLKVVQGFDSVEFQVIEPFRFDLLATIRNSTIASIHSNIGVW